MIRVPAILTVLLMITVLTFVDVSIIVLVTHRRLLAQIIVFVIKYALQIYLVHVIRNLVQIVVPIVLVITFVLVIHIRNTVLVTMSVVVTMFAVVINSVVVIHSVHVTQYVHVISNALAIHN